MTTGFGAVTPRKVFSTVTLTFRTSCGRMMVISSYNKCKDLLRLEQLPLSRFAWNFSRDIFQTCCGRQLVQHRNSSSSQLFPIVFCLDGRFFFLLTLLQTFLLISVNDYEWENVWWVSRLIVVSFPATFLFRQSRKTLSLTVIYYKNRVVLLFFLIKFWSHI